MEEFKLKFATKEVEDLFKNDPYFADEFSNTTNNIDSENISYDIFGIPSNKIGKPVPYDANQKCYESYSDMYRDNYQNNLGVQYPCENINKIINKNSCDDDAYEHDMNQRDITLLQLAGLIPLNISLCIHWNNDQSEPGLCLNIIPVMSNIDNYQFPEPTGQEAIDIIEDRARKRMIELGLNPEHQLLPPLPFPPHFAPFNDHTGTPYDEMTKRGMFNNTFGSTSNFNHQFNSWQNRSTQQFANQSQSVFGMQPLMPSNGYIPRQTPPTQKTFGLNNPQFVQQPVYQNKNDIPIQMNYNNTLYNHPTGDFGEVVKQNNNRYVTGGLLDSSRVYGELPSLNYTLKDYSIDFYLSLYNEINGIKVNDFINGFVPTKSGGPGNEDGWILMNHWTDEPLIISNYVDEPLWTGIPQEDFKLRNEYLKACNDKAKELGKTSEYEYRCYCKMCNIEPDENIIKRFYPRTYESIMQERNRNMSLDENGVDVSKLTSEEREEYRKAIEYEKLMNKYKSFYAESYMIHNYRPDIHNNYTPFQEHFIQMQDMIHALCPPDISAADYCTQGMGTVDDYCKYREGMYNGSNKPYDTREFNRTMQAHIDRRAMAYWSQHPHEYEKRLKQITGEDRFTGPRQYETLIKDENGEFRAILPDTPGFRRLDRNSKEFYDRRKLFKQSIQKLDPNAIAPIDDLDVRWGNANGGDEL